MRLRLWGTRAILVAVVPLAAAGCGIGGGGSSTPATNTSTLNESLLPHVKRQKRAHHQRPRPSRPAPPSTVAIVSQAAALSRAEPGLRGTATLTTRVPGDSAARRAQIAVSDAIGQNALLARLTLPVAVRAGRVRSVAVRVVVRDGTMYLEPPGVFAQRVSPVKRWWAVSLAGLPAFNSDTRVGPLIRAASAMNAPGSYLTYVSSFAGGMHRLGSATVNGIRTTHYKALVTVAQAAKTVPAPLSSSIAPPLQAALAADPNALVAVDVWIDASRLVRRLHLSMTAQSRKGQPIELSLQQDFHSYLGVATPSTPLARNTAHLTASG